MPTVQSSKLGMPSNSMVAQESHTTLSNSCYLMGSLLFQENEGWPPPNSWLSYRYCNCRQLATNMKATVCLGMDSL